MKQKVVVIGHGYTSRLGIVRSLSDQCCELSVIVLLPGGFLSKLLRLMRYKPIDCHSKYVNRVLYCYAEEYDLISLLVSKCKDSNQKVILIPDDDFSAYVLDNNKALLKDSFLFPRMDSSSNSVEHWMRKTEQKKLAEDLGLKVTNDCVVEIKDGNYSIPNGVRYPCFIKAMTSLSGGKRFFQRCDGEEDLNRFLDIISKQFANTAVLVEDYKIINKEFAVVGFSDGNKVVIPGLLEFKANSLSHFGVAREGTIGPAGRFEQLIELFRVYVRKIGFSGLFDIDFYESNGEYYFGEMNFRFGGSGYAYTAVGANLPAMLVHFFRGEGNGEIRLHKIVKTVSFVNERMLVDDYTHGYISFSQCKEAIHNADIQFVFNPNDIEPYKSFKRSLFKAWVNRLRFRIIKK